VTTEAASAIQRRWRRHCADAAAVAAARAITTARRLALARAARHTAAESARRAARAHEVAAAEAAQRSAQRSRDRAALLAAATREAERLHRPRLLRRTVLPVLRSWRTAAVAERRARAVSSWWCAAVLQAWRSAAKVCDSSSSASAVCTLVVCRSNQFITVFYALSAQCE
jgi:hypothetical protein